MWRNYLSVRHVAFYRVPSDFCRPARCASDQWHIVALSYTLSRDTTEETPCRTRASGVSYLWGVLPNGGQYASQIHDALTVQAQSFDGRTADGRPSHDDRGVLAPEKVLAPALLARMKKRDHDAGDRVQGLDTHKFEVVAALTGERQIAGVIAASCHAGDDVFDRKRVRRVPHGAPAVLAIALRPPDDRLSGTG